MVALQLGNIYFLLAMVGIAVLYTTTEARVVRNYVIALWLADIGHVAVTCWVMDHESLTDVANWNAMAWGNIGVTASICMSYFYIILTFRHRPFSFPYEQPTFSAFLEKIASQRRPSRNCYKA
jgi:hypothetical protein